MQQKTRLIPQLRNTLSLLLRVLAQFSLFSSRDFLTVFFFPSFSLPSSPSPPSSSSSSPPAQQNQAPRQKERGEEESEAAFGGGAGR
eukprot:2730302-Rhodomonas_salina.2